MQNRDNSCLTPATNFNQKALVLGKKGHCTIASFDLTSHCNASCDYCYAIDNSKKDMSFAKVKKVLDKLANNGIMYIVFTGGEIFLREDIIEILSYTISKNFWKITLLTNATLITDKQINFIIEHSDFIKTIQISIFSLDPSIHNLYLGVNGALKKALAVAKKLKNGGVHVTAAYNILDINYKNYKKDSAILQKEYFSEVKRSTLKITSNINNNSFTLDYNQICNVLNYSPLLLKSEQERMRISLGKNKTIEKGLCGGIFTSFHIDSDGSLRPCITFRKIKAGSIFEKESLYNIFQKYPIYNEIKTLKKIDILECKNCKFFNYCRACIGISHTETGSIYHTSLQFCNFANSVEKCQ